MTITLLAPDGVAVTAQQERQARAATHGGGSGRQLGGRSGFRVGTPSTVLTATGTTWTLGACAAMLDPGASTHQGMYGWSTDANVTGAVTAADATNPRKDIVYIQVNDSTAGDGSGAVTANVLYLAGTPGVTPSAPALPARSFLVGTITVPQAGGGSPTVALNPARYVAAGAPLPVSSQAERDALTSFDGLTVRRMDVASRPLETHDGTQWLPANISAILSSTSGAIAAGAAGSLNALVLDTVNSQNPGSIGSPANSQIQVGFAGVYAFHMHVSFSPNTAGWLAIKNQAGNGTYALVNFPSGGEQSVSIPNLYLAAGAIVQFIITPSTAQPAGVSAQIRVTKVG